MKTNPVKALLKAGKPAYGTWLSFGDLLAARILARLGFDWITVDMEHSSIDWSQVAVLVGAIADAGCVPIVRVPEGNHRDIKRALDAGAWGIVAPMVDTVEQAQEIIAAAKFPPVGRRSLGAVTPSLNFSTSPGEYFAKANEEVLVILQTESPMGIANAEAIYRLPGVDAIFVGPVDLRARLSGADGEPATAADLEVALAQVVAAGRKTDTPTGMHVMDAATAKHRAGQGMQFIAIASDLRFMSIKAAEEIGMVRPEMVGRTSIGY
jgi:4-hydroxy-2-oxoheptanedioate aldolase